MMATDKRLAKDFVLNMMAAVEDCLVWLKSNEELDMTEDQKSSEVLSPFSAPLLYARWGALRGV